MVVTRSGTGMELPGLKQEKSLSMKDITQILRDSKDYIEEAGAISKRKERSGSSPPTISSAPIQEREEMYNPYFIEDPSVSMLKKIKRAEGLIQQLEEKLLDQEQESAKEISILKSELDNVHGRMNLIDNWSVDDVLETPGIGERMQNVQNTMTSLKKEVRDSESVKRPQDVMTPNPKVVKRKISTMENRRVSGNDMSALKTGVSRTPFIQEPVPRYMSTPISAPLSSKVTFKEGDTNDSWLASRVNTLVGSALSAHMSKKIPVYDNDSDDSDNDDNNGSVVGRSAGVTPAFKKAYVRSVERPERPKKFSGENNDNFLNWYNHYTIISALNGWDRLSTSERSLRLRSCLIGRALSSLQGLTSSDLRNVDNVVSRLKQVFSPLSAESWGAALYCVSRKPAETLSELSTRISDMVHHAYPAMDSVSTQRICIDSFCRAVGPKLSLKLREQSFKDFSTCVERAYHLSEIYGDGGENVRALHRFQNCDDNDDDFNGEFDKVRMVTGKRSMPVDRDMTDIKGCMEGIHQMLVDLKQVVTKPGGDDSVSNNSRCTKKPWVRTMTSGSSDRIVDKSNITCFSCQNKGHYANECRENNRLGRNWNAGRSSQNDRRSFNAPNRSFNQVNRNDTVNQRKWSPIRVSQSGSPFNGQQEEMWE